MQSGKAQVQEVQGHAAKDKTKTNFQLMNKLSLDQSESSCTVVIDLYRLSYISDE